MDNAAKWSPPGGHVGVTMRQLDPSHAELVVSDHGPGHSTARAPPGVRAVLPVDDGAGDAGFGTGAGDRQKGGAQPRRIAARRGHRAGRSAAGYLDSTCCFPAGRCRFRRTPTRGARQPKIDARRPTPRARGRRPGELSGFGERYLSGLSVRAGKVGLQLLLEPSRSTSRNTEIEEERRSDMTNDPRYSPPPQQPGYRPAPNQPAPRPEPCGDLSVCARGISSRTTSNSTGAISKPQHDADDPIPSAL